MARKYTIAHSLKTELVNVVYDKKVIGEVEFWETVKADLKQVTKQKPDQYQTLFNAIEVILKRGKSVTIGDRCFQISGKKH